MDAGTRRVLLAAAIGALAVAVAAATLDSAVQAPAGGGAGAPPPATGTGPPAGGPAPPCVPWLATPAAALALLGGLGAGTLLASRRYGRLEAAAFAVGIGLPSLGLYARLTACTTEDLRRRMLGRLRELPAGPASGGGSTALDPGVPSTVLGVALLGGLLVAGLLLYLSLRGGDDGLPGDDGPADPDAAARAAGSAADRIAAGGDLESEIHRAWRDMAAHLDVARPATSTPGEFAAAAVDAGMPPDAVGELTDLFERVRYGGLEATSALEARALDALQRIEDRSGAGEGGSARG